MRNNRNWLSRTVRDIINFNKNAAAAPVLNDLEDQVLGHPEILRKFNVSMKSNELEK